MKIYTKTGDKGETSLVDGQRVSKSHIRLEAYGSVDELNATLALVASETAKLELTELHQSLLRIQNQLFTIGSQLACGDEATSQKLPQLNPEWSTKLEQDMDKWQEDLPALKDFILPGDSRPAALAHFARTVCRRAERQIVRLKDLEKVDFQLLLYINRLSDWLFTLARKINREQDINDQIWTK